MLRSLADKYLVTIVQHVASVTCFDRAYEMYLYAIGLFFYLVSHYITLLDHLSLLIEQWDSCSLSMHVLSFACIERWQWEEHMG